MSKVTKETVEHEAGKIYDRMTDFPCVHCGAEFKFSAVVNKKDRSLDVSFGFFHDESCPVVTSGGRN